MTLTEQLDRLAAFEPTTNPVVSLYLNAQPGQTGRDQFQSFIRKEFAARSETYPRHTKERESLDRDLERISRYLDTELQASANGVAVFACSASDLFEAVQLGAPMDRHWLSIGPQPHLYPLARIDSRYPRAAAVLADTQSARILVVATGEVVSTRDVAGVRTRRTAQGGWSQARYQRHIENFHVQHAKEVIGVLDEVVAAEGLSHVLIAGDEVITPLLREQMPKHLAEKVVDHLTLDTYAPVTEVLDATLAAMRKVNERTQQEKVEAAIGAYRAGGLGVAGPEETLNALVKGQVEELLVTASLNNLEGLDLDAATAHDLGIAAPSSEAAAAGEPAGASPEAVRLSDELVRKARQTGARVTFVDDPALLAPYGGTAALLRFSI